MVCGVCVCLISMEGVCSALWTLQEVVWQEVTGSGLVWQQVSYLLPSLSPPVGVYAGILS